MIVTTKHLAAEKRIVWNRPPAPYAYLREIFTTVQQPPRFGPFSWAEVIAWVETDYQLLGQLEQPKQSRCFFLSHDSSERLDGLEAPRKDRYGGRCVAVSSIRAGEFAEPPCGAFFVSDSDRKLAADARLEARTYWAQWAQGNRQPAAAEPEPTPKSWLGRLWGR